LLSEAPALDGAVNKPSCQPEKPENSQVKTWDSASTLGVELAPPRNLASNRRKRAVPKTLRNVAYTGEDDGWRCCQQNRRLELGQKWFGSPENVVSNHLSKLIPCPKAVLPLLV
jgi:hypothetical protein